MGAQGRLQVRRRAGPAAPPVYIAPTPVESPAARGAPAAAPRAPPHAARARARLPHAARPPLPSRCDLFDYDCAAKERAAKKALAEAEA